MRGNGQTVVGAFVLGGLVLALGAIVLFGKFNLFNPSIKAAVVFEDSIAGLAVGAPVTFRGVRVGSVESIAIEFDPKTHTAYIPVIVRIDPDSAKVARGAGSNSVDLSALITRGLRAELNLQSFVTGQSAIDLDFDPSAPAILHGTITNLPEIPTRQSTIQRAKEQLSQLPLRELADDSRATLESLRALSEKLDDDLPPLVESLRQTSDHSAQLVDLATQTLRDLQGKLDSTLGHVDQLAITGNRQLDQGGTALHALLIQSTEAMQEARDVLRDLKSATSNRGATRADLESTLRDLSSAAASLRGFASDVEHNPQLLLTGRRQ